MRARWPFSDTSFSQSSGFGRKRRVSCRSETLQSPFDARRQRLRGGGRRHRRRRSGQSTLSSRWARYDLRMLPGRFTKGAAREIRQPGGVEKRMLIFRLDGRRWESLYVDIGYPISEKRYRMFRGFGMFRKRGLRPWVLNILRKSPKTGAEIIDEIENMSQGWWRPSPGSIYPMLKGMVQDGLLKEREDGRYELTSKAKEEDEFPFRSHFTGPRSVDAMLDEIIGYIYYFEDLIRTDRSKLEPYADKIRTITERLTTLSK